MVNLTNNADVIYIKSEQKWSELIEDCKSYIENERQEYEDGGMADNYQEQLNNLQPMDWDVFVNSGIFHDAIGKLAYHNENWIGVFETY